jgi:hypothetical protein
MAPAAGTTRHVIFLTVGTRGGNSATSEVTTLQPLWNLDLRATNRRSGSYLARHSTREIPMSNQNQNPGQQNQNPGQKPGQQQGGGQKPGQQQQDPNRQGQNPNQQNPNQQGKGGR